MAYPSYVRDKARKLRVEKHLSIDEIAERLALPKTTIYYNESPTADVWVGEIGARSMASLP